MSVLSVDLLEELLDLLLNEVVDLVGELLSLARKGLGAVNNLSRDDVHLLLDGSLNLLKSGSGASGLVTTSSDDLGVVAAATTIPSQKVGGVSVGHASESTLGGDSDQVLLELLGGDGSERVLGVLSGLEREVVGEETANVGGGHRSARDGVDGVLGPDPGGLNAQARSKNVGALAKVGEISAAIVEGRSADGNGFRRGGRRVLAGIRVVIASSDGKVDARANGGVDSGIESLGLTSTQRHVGNGAFEALALAILGGLDVVKVAGGGILNALDNIGHAARAVGAENLDGVDVRLLGDAVLLTSNSS